MSRSYLEDQLVAAARGGAPVAERARALGFGGRTLRSLADPEVERLAAAVWPADADGLLPDDSPRAVDLHRRLDELQF